MADDGSTATAAPEQSEYMKLLNRPTEDVETNIDPAPDAPVTPEQVQATNPASSGAISGTAAGAGSGDTGKESAPMTAGAEEKAADEPPMPGPLPREDQQTAPQVPQQQQQTPAAMSPLDLVRQQATSPIPEVKPMERHEMPAMNAAEAKPPEKEKKKEAEVEKHDYASDMTHAIGTFAKETAAGLGLAAGGVADMVQSMIPPPTTGPAALISAMTGAKPQPYQSMEKQAEQAEQQVGVTPEEQKSLPAQGAKFLGEAVPFMEGSVTAPGALAEMSGKALGEAAGGALGIGEKAAEGIGNMLGGGARLAEGAAIGAMQSAANQMSEKGHVDAGEQALDAALGALLPGAAMAAKKGLKALIKKMGPQDIEELLKEAGRISKDNPERALKLAEKAKALVEKAKAAREAAEEARKQIEELTHTLVDDAQAMEHRGIEAVQKAFGPGIPENEIATKQKELMDAADKAIFHLSLYPDILHVDTPEGVAAIKTLFDAGYNGIKDIQAAVQKYMADVGLAPTQDTMGPFLLEMKKAAVAKEGDVLTPPAPQTPHERFVKLAEEMRGLDAAAKQAAARKAFYGQHGEPPVSREASPAPAAYKPLLLGLHPLVTPTPVSQAMREALEMKARLNKRAFEGQYGEPSVSREAKTLEGKVEQDVNKPEELKAVAEKLEDEVKKDLDIAQHAPAPFKQALLAVREATPDTIDNAMKTALSHIPSNFPKVRKGDMKKEVELAYLHHKGLMQQALKANAAKLDAMRPHGSNTTYIHPAFNEKLAEKPEAEPYQLKPEEQALEDDLKKYPNHATMYKLENGQGWVARELPYNNLHDMYSHYNLRIEALENNPDKTSTEWKELSEDREKYRSLSEEWARRDDQAERDNHTIEHATSTDQLRDIFNRSRVVPEQTTIAAVLKHDELEAAPKVNPLYHDLFHALEKGDKNPVASNSDPTWMELQRAYSEGRINSPQDVHGMVAPTPTTPEEHIAQQAAAAQKVLDNIKDFRQEFLEALDKREKVKPGSKEAKVLDAKLDDLHGKISANMPAAAAETAAEQAARREATQGTLKGEVENVEQSQKAENESPAVQALKAIAPEKSPEQLDAAKQELAEAKGPFRRNLKGKEYMGYGFAAEDRGTQLEQLQKLVPMPEELYNKAKAALVDLGKIKSGMIHYKDEVNHNGRRAFALAAQEPERYTIEHSEAGEPEKILDTTKPEGHQVILKRTEEKKLKSEHAATLANAKAALKLEQDEAKKTELRAQISDLQRELETPEGRAKRRVLEGKLHKIDAALQEINNPLSGMSEKEHLYTAPGEPHKFAQHNAMERNKPENLRTEPKTLEAAIKAFDKSNDALESLKTAWKHANKEHLLTFRKLNAEYHKVVDPTHPEQAPISLALEHTLTHPEAPGVTTRAVTQVHFNPGFDVLHGKWRVAYDAIAGPINNLSSNFHTIKGYARAGRAMNFSSPKTAHEYLAANNIYHPGMRGAGLAIFTGITAFAAQQQADAADLDNMTPQQQDRYFGDPVFWGVGAAAATAYTTAALFGPPGVKRALRHPSWYWRILTRNIGAFTTEADQHLGITEPHLSLGHAINELRGSLSMAHTLCDDYPEYLAAVSTGKYDGKKLSPNGVKAVQYAHDAEKAFRGFVKDYVDEQWTPFYDNAPENMKTRLKETDDVVHFIRDAYVNPKNHVDSKTKGIAKFYARTMHSMFVGNAKNWIGAMASEMIDTGPLGLGTSLYALAAKELAPGVNPALTEALKRVKVPGPLSHAVAESAPERNTLNKPLLIEARKARVLYAGMAAKYYGMHPTEMSSKGFQKWTDFAKWSTEGDPGDPLMMDFHMKYSQLAAEVAKADHSGIEKDIVQRTPVLKPMVWLLSHQLTNAQLVHRKVGLIINNAIQGDYKAMLGHAFDLSTHLTAKYQLAGAMALPVVGNWALQNMGATHDYIVKINAFLNNTSLGYQLLGEQSNLGDDPIFPGATGMSNNMVEDVQNSVSALVQSAKTLGKIVRLTSERGVSGLVAGNPAEPEVAQTQAGLAALFRVIQNTAPTILAVPARFAANGATAIPEFMNAEYNFSTPQLGMGGGAAFDKMAAEGRHVYYPVPKTDAEGNPLETQQQAEWRARVDAVKDLLGFQNPTKSAARDAIRDAKFNGLPPQLQGMVKGE